MSEKIMSAVDSQLNHIVFRLPSSKSETFERTEIIEPQNFLQAAFLQIPSKFGFRAHSHLTRHRTFEKLIAQEAWVVIQGQVEVTYFDTDDTIQVSKILGPGDATVTLRGGHSYRTLEEDAIVFEFKSGPYEGVEIDKRFI